jgi:hypothetical protein
MMEITLINNGCIGITAQICYHLTIIILICVHVMKRKETVRLVTSYACARFSLDQIKSINVQYKLCNSYNSNYACELCNVVKCSGVK